MTAARLLGATHTRIIFKRLLPNLMQSALVIGTFAMASAIIAEAALSFLGLGAPPPAHLITALAINMLGDPLRDNPDPKLKRLGGRA